MPCRPGSSARYLKPNFRANSTRRGGSTEGGRLGPPTWWARVHRVPDRGRRGPRRPGVVPSMVGGAVTPPPPIPWSAPLEGWEPGRSIARRGGGRAGRGRRWRRCPGGRVDDGDGELGWPTPGVQGESAVAAVNWTAKWIATAAAWTAAHPGESAAIAAILVTNARPGRRWPGWSARPTLRRSG